MATRPGPLALALLALASTASLAQDPCSELFHDPGTGDPTTLAVLVEQPAPGTELRSFLPSCPPTVEVSGIASAVGIPPRFDFYVAIDVSGSTTGTSFVDVNGDGWPDSVLSAEVAAVRQFVRSIDLSLHRVCLIPFSDRADVGLPLTSDPALIESHLDVIDGSSGGRTNFGAPLQLAVRERALSGDPGRTQVILFLSDGMPNETWTFPPGHHVGCHHDAASCAGVYWAEHAADHGMIVDTFAVGVDASAAILSEMARRGRGQHVALTVAGEIASVLPRVIHVGVRDVAILNDTTGASVTLAPSPDGRFSVDLPIAPGRNDIRVVARSDHQDAWQVACTTDAMLTCLETRCPPSVTRECEASGTASVAGLVAWASDSAVAITNDSPHDGGETGDEDASGRYPVGSTTVTFTFRDAVAGTHECTTRVHVRDTTPPEITGFRPELFATCPGVPPATPVATDSCDTSPGLVRRERRLDGPCPDTYDVVREFTATDAWGNVSTAEQVVHVRDDEPPRLVGVPPDATLECSTPVPPPAAVRGVDGCDGTPVVTLRERRMDGGCPGEWTLERTWTAVDRCGNAGEAKQVLTFVDRTPPSIAGSAEDVKELWPPRHELQSLAASDFHPRVSDDCSGASWLLASCVSDQPEDGLGDGHTTGDCLVAPDGRSLAVRAERSGTDARGRTYVVSIVATDGCGNATPPTPVGVVHVPHDRSKRGR